MFFSRSEKSLMSQKFIENTDCLWYEVAWLEIEWCESIYEWIINKNYQNLKKTAVSEVSQTQISSI